MTSHIVWADIVTVLINETAHRSWRTPPCSIIRTTMNYPWLPLKARNAFCLSMNIHSSDLKSEKTKITIAQQVNEKVHREGGNRFCSFTMLEWSGNERRMWYGHLLIWISMAKWGPSCNCFWFSLFSSIIYVILTFSKKFPTISRMKKTLETLWGHEVTTMAPWPDGQKKWRKEICSGSPLYYIP